VWQRQISVLLVTDYKWLVIRKWWWSIQLTNVRRCFIDYVVRVDTLTIYTHSVWGCWICYRLHLWLVYSLSPQSTVVYHLKPAYCQLDVVYLKSPPSSCEYCFRHSNGRVPTTDAIALAWLDFVAIMSYSLGITFNTWCSHWRLHCSHATACTIR
jgi:hypothetical protein